MEAQAAALRRGGAFEAVACAFLTLPPAPAEALAALRGDPLCIVPLFLSDGYFVRVALPRALGAAGDHRRRVQAPPVGLMPELTGVVEARALAACAGAGLAPARCGLLLVAHGSASGSPASRDAALWHAGRLAGTGRFRWTDIALLEEPPDIADRLAAHAGDDLVVVGLFNAPGGHAAEDVPEALAADPHRDRRRVVYTGAIGAEPAMAGVIAAAAHLALVEGS